MYVLRILVLKEIEEKFGFKNYMVVFFIMIDFLPSVTYLFHYIYSFMGLRTDFQFFVLSFKAQKNLVQ